MGGYVIWVEGRGGGELKEKQITNKEIEKDYELIKLQQPGIIPILVLNCQMPFEKRNFITTRFSNGVTKCCALA